MGNIAGFPNFEIEFNKNGAANDPAAVKQVLDFLAQGTVTDLLIISHGWNNDMAEARDLYRRFFARVREVMDGHHVAGIDTRKFAVISVLWPSKKFAEEELIPSGAAATGSPVTEAFIVKQLNGLKGVFDKPDADAVLEQGGLGVLDMYSARWWSPRQWTARFIDRSGFAVEDFSVRRLVSVTSAEIAERYEVLRQCTAFEALLEPSATST